MSEKYLLEWEKKRKRSGKIHFEITQEGYADILKYTFKINITIRKSL